jgi:RNA-binding motif X-linked protein 2
MNGGRDGGNRPQGICFAFQKGNCDRGDSCKYSHDANGGRSGNGSSSGFGYRPQGREDRPQGREAPKGRGARSARSRSPVRGRQGGRQGDRQGREGRDKPKEDAAFDGQVVAKADDAKEEADTETAKGRRRSRSRSKSSSSSSRSRSRS